jgi:uncharacterized protein YodC (DUF2158 family)
MMARMPQLDIGDVVTLPSGGPAMTVAELLPWGDVYCLWFRSDGTAAGQVFSCEMLRLQSSDHEWITGDAAAAR